MMLKFIDNEKKGGFGKLSKGWRMMFADTDVEKMRMTLSKSRDALRMSSAMFRWSLGDAKVDSSVGIGYTGLAAALDRMNQGRATSLPPLHPPPHSDLPDLPVAIEQSPLPPVPSITSSTVGRSSTTNLRNRSEDYHVRTDAESLHRMRTRELDDNAHYARNDDNFHPPPIHDRPVSRGSASMQRRNSWRNPSARSSEMTTSSVRDTAYQRGLQPQSEPFYEDEAMRSSRTLIEDQILDLDLQDTYPNEGTYRKADVVSAPRWNPRQVASSRAGGKAALVSAVQQRNHRTLEQLLEGGARADGRVESAMLRTAAQNRDSESISLLLRHGVDVNSLDNEGFSPLFTVTQVSFFEGAKLLLKNGADPNLSAGPDSESPLALAAGENRIDLVQMYLKHGGDPDLVMASGNTAMIRAMNQTASTQLVELLLTSGADPNAKSGEGATPLFQAIQANRVDLMTVLLDHKANPNLPGPKHPLWPSTYKPKALQLLLARGADHKKTPGIMELAASLKKMESIAILIKAGVTPNARKDGAYTPLCSAIRDNSADILTFLLDNGADPNYKASEYPAWKCITHSRIHFLPQLVAAGADLHNPKGIIETAVEFNDKEALMYLLDQGVNPNDRTPQGRTALTTAIRDDRSELVDILLANRADPAGRGEDWPLCMAVKRPAILKKLLGTISNPRAFRGVIEMAVVADQLESIKHLLKAGVSVEDKNCGVFSPLTTAIRERNKEITRFLLDEAEADPNAPGEHLPLVKALRRYETGDPEIIHMLLARGADINKMHRGWNPVLQAVENGDADILRLLIDRGGPVDLQAKDESGRPVIDIVTERGWEEGLSLMFPNAEARQ
ncbi:ankyrin repeat-containing domain protein [Massariosphaeria phaeospora]|uniref:Ankyrin repeat-containing domain protein n=1 Tax=Massariosphaeria phaeospora TaxID=100035 RepID=A0A7C8MFK8_9PLEO|nr:ankyrin repeat-containing domain protein [Massariosphaeria phaeospora]